MFLDKVRESQSIELAPIINDESPLAAKYALFVLYSNALRFDYDMASLHPKVMAVYEACNQLEAFTDARPENQPDAVRSKT